MEADALPVLVQVACMLGNLDISLLAEVIGARICLLLGWGELLIGASV